MHITSFITDRQAIKARFAGPSTAILALALITMGCGGADTESGPTEGPEVAACRDFCQAAAAVGCPKHGDCQSDCEGLAGLGCVALFVDLLQCAGPALTGECVPRDGDGELTCTSQMGAWDSCLPLDFGVPLEQCGPSNAESDAPASGCSGSVDCGAVDLAVECDAEGNCTCAKNGQTVGTCTSILSSAYLCAPHRSCCTAIFSPG